MIKQHQIITMTWNELPSKLTSYRLLDEIYKRVKPSLSSIKREVDEPLILYGAGNLGKMAKRYFDKLDIPISFILDKNSDLVDLDGVRVFRSFDDKNKKDYLLVICIVTSSYYEISSQLKSEGWTDIVPFYDITLAYQDKHPLNNGWCTGLLDREDMEGMEYVLSNLQDNISCAHYLQFIAYHSLREEWIFKDAPIENNDRYFIPEIVSILNDHETFVDIGAHHGEISKKFMDIVNDRYKYIYMFESDIDNAEYIRDYLKKYYPLYIDLYPNALGSINEKRKFYSDSGYSSQLSKLGNEIVCVSKLDDFKINSSFIKIHTEGNEDDVIKGGLETIKKNRPIISTTCYHNRKGLWQLPRLLIGSLENYIFYFRLHSWYGTGALIYAIPKERLK